MPAALEAQATKNRAKNPSPWEIESFSNLDGQSPVVEFPEEVARTAVNPYDRVFWIVLDSVGIGELPDAADYGDVGRNTLGHIAESRPLRIPNLVQFGLANIAPLQNLAQVAQPAAAY